MFIRIFRVFYKLLFILILFLVYVCISGITVLIPFEKYNKRKKLSAVNSFASSVMIVILNIKIHYTGFDKIQSGKTWFVMGNHVSYVDVFALVKKLRTLLITSTELKRRGVLGLISILAGSLYVDRKKITTIKNEIPEISEAFKRKINVLLFPEATCSNGEALLPFKSGLMGAVSGTGADILPACIMYKKINGREFRISDFRTIGYFGGMKFAPQFIKLLMLGSLEVEIEFLDPVQAGEKDRKEMSAAVFERISARYELYLNTVK